jgi:PIN domain
MPQIKYVLIDFENIQPANIESLDRDDVRVLVFVGASQNKLSFEIIESIQKLGTKATYVKISGNGPNALDFHIAYYIGKISKQEELAAFRVVSKDTGFDPLIDHLKEQGLNISRHKVLAEIVGKSTQGVQDLSHRVNVVVENLSHRGASKPRTIKTLGSTIKALFKPPLEDDQLNEVLKRLLKQSVIKFEGTKVIYSLPEQAKASE